MKSSTRRIIRDYFFTALFALAIALIIRTYGIEAYRIPSFAMKPTLLPGDTIFVTKWPYSVRQNQIPARGEIIVFSQLPQTGVTGPDFIKRVVGLPGDEISIRNGNLLVNHIQLQRVFETNPDCFSEVLPEGRKYRVCKEVPFIENFGPEKVPPNSVFVIGDLRSSSTDTKKRKTWGITPLSSIKGKALWLWLSIDPEKNESSSSWLPKFRFDRMFQRIQ